MLKFEKCQVWNQSKCWNMSDNCKIDQNVEIWLKSNNLNNQNV